MHFTIPFLTALAALGATVEGATCSRKQYADVAHQIQNPAFFCKFWLENKRTSTPLRKYGVRSLTNLCRCFVANSPRVQGPFKPLRPNPPPSDCSRSLYRPLKNQYSDPAFFCKWWLGAPRTISPIPAVNNPATVNHACRCYLNKRFPQQSSSTAVNTTPRTTADTETSTDDSEPTATSSGVVGPIGATTTTASERTSSMETRGTSTVGLPTILPTTTTSAETTSAETTSQATIGGTSTEDTSSATGTSTA